MVNISHLAILSVMNGTIWRNIDGQVGASYVHYVRKGLNIANRNGHVILGTGPLDQKIFCGVPLHEEKEWQAYPRRIRWAQI